MGDAPNSMDHLARELQSARAAAGLSLRAVAEGAGISAAYLQKLERGLVGEPSPRIIRRLAQVLQLDYRRLMELAGYEPPAPRGRSSKNALEVRLAAADLTVAEEQAVAAFIDHLITNRSSPRPRSQR